MVAECAYYGYIEDLWSGQSVCDLSKQLVNKNGVAIPICLLVRRKWPYWLDDTCVPAFVAADLLSQLNTVRTARYYS